MKIITLVAVLILLACGESVDPERYVLAADFDENEKILLVYFPDDAIISLIKTLGDYEKLGVIVAQESHIPETKKALVAAGVNMEHIEFFPMPKLDIWMRDNGPAIIKNRNGQLKAIDFKSNVIEFERSDKDIAQRLNLPLVRSNLRSVGGARESNGEGVIILTENYYEVNTSGKRKEFIEKELKENCGIDEVIWLKKGLVEDEPFVNGPVYQNIYPVGSGGHIDEFCRFVNKNTVLLAEVPEEDRGKHPINQANYERLEENFDILKMFGKKGIKTIRIPTAELEFDKYLNPATGEEVDIIQMASYLNFVIGNKVVLAAKYYEEGKPLSVKEKDEKVAGILGELFPNHKIIQLNPKFLNAWGGGYHCWTYNLPAQKNNN